VVYGRTITVSTNGFSDIVNITDQVLSAISGSGIVSGIVSVTAIGSTTSVTTMEFESARVEEMKEFLSSLLPESLKVPHLETWGDDNAFSRMLAALMGPGIVLPVENGKIRTGQWQQVVLVDHDSRPRTRQVRIQIVGDEPATNKAFSD